MKMKTLSLGVISGLLLAGCGDLVRKNETYQRIGDELTRAAVPAADPVAQAMVPPLAVEAPAVAAAPREARFNLAVSEAPVGQVLTALVAGTPYSMTFSPEVTGNVSLNLKNTTVREVLETLHEVYGYEFQVRGKRIIVKPNGVQTRIFRINYLASRRQGMTDVRLTGNSPSTSTAPAGQGSAAQPSAAGSGGTNAAQTQAADSARVRTTSDYDFWKDLDTAIRSIVGGEGRSVVINPASGVVMVKASPGELRSVEDYLKATQLIVERQVMLEAKIIEVVLNDSYQTGVNWANLAGATDKIALGVMSPGVALSATGALVGSATGVSSGTTVTATPGAGGALATGTTGKGFFGLAFQSKDFSALISFLEGQGDVQVLSSPRIATTNNQKAVLKVGNDDYFVTGVSTTTTASASGNVVTPNIQLQPFFSGIALDVTPQIDDEGNIVLHVHPSVSVVEEKTKIVNLGELGEFTLPLASSNINETDSIVRVRDGGVVAIGGLMSQEQSNTRNGLPGVSGLPGLGTLFGQKAAVSRKRELVILMRSTVIKGDEQWRQSITETGQRLQDLDPGQRRQLDWQ